MPQTKRKQAIAEDQGAPASAVPVAAPKTIVELQARTMATRDVADELYPTRLVVTGGDDTVIYHVDLPVSVLIALLDPGVPDGFIEVAVQATSVHLPIGGKHRFLHTSQIREVLFDKELPEGALGGEA